MQENNYRILIAITALATVICRHMRLAYPTVVCGLILAADLAFPSPARAIVYGVDVYSGNGTMNWPLIAGGGKDFAMVKATEGVGFQDSKLSQNESNGTAAGLYIGCYDFAHPENNTPVAEADYFVNYAKPLNAFAAGHLDPMLDMETGAARTSARHRFPPGATPGVPRSSD